MATYALIHGGGDVGWSWHLVERELRARGHDTVAPDLPIEDPEATLLDHAQVVIDAIGDRGEVIVVGHSAGGYVAPIVADRVHAERLILIAAMIARPGETAAEMFAATGWRMPPNEDPSDLAVFYHDVDPALAAKAISKERREAGGDEPWPLPAWPSVPTHFIVCRDDRFFSADWLRQVVRDRLSIEADEFASGHTPALSHPVELVDLMESYR